MARRTIPDEVWDIYHQKRKNILALARKRDRCGADEELSSNEDKELSSDEETEAEADAVFFAKRKEEHRQALLYQARYGTIE